MRIVSGVFFIAMVLFTVVQFNDPDALYWGMIYGIAAIWCALAAFHPTFTTRFWSQRLLLTCLVLAAVGTVWYFPKTPGFWQTEVWWVTETAREGMGMMIAFVAISIAWVTGRKYTVIA